MFFFDTCKDNNAVANAMKLASNAEPQLTLCKGKKSLERIAIPLDEKKNVHLKENSTAFRGRIFLINKKCDLAGIQTLDLQNRNLTLYSAKLRGRRNSRTQPIRLSRTAIARAKIAIFFNLLSY
jgi:hypothetical protein